MFRGTLRSFAALTLAACAPTLPACGPGAAQGKASEFDAARAWKHLEAQVAIGPRPAGSEGAEKNRLYIEGELKALGLTPVREAFTVETPVGKLDMVNVYADIPGSPRSSGPAPVVILCSHYDTKRLEVPFIGANDGASSTGVLLELARVLAKDAPHRVAYRLLFLDGEEATRFTWVDPDNRYGSRHHAAGLQKSGDAARVKACIVIDMVGDKDLVLERDSYSDSRLFEAFAASAKAQGLEQHISKRGQPVSDDHLSFMAIDIKSCDLIDLDFGPNNSWWHTGADTVDKCSPDSLSVIGRIVVGGLPQVEELALK